MPSLPTAAAGPERAAELAALLTVLAAVPDPRARRGVRHPLSQLLAVGLSAVIAGARSFAAIGEWAAGQTSAGANGDGLGRAPDESTFRRVFARLDADALSAVIGAWLWTRTTVRGGRRVIAIDGKTIRGARRRDRAAPHLVAALDHATGTVLGQLAIAAKTNEIPAVRTLLAGFEVQDRCERGDLEALGRCSHLPERDTSGVVDDGEQVHPGTVRADGAAAGLAIHGNRPERLGDRWRRRQGGQPGMQYGVEDVGVDDEQDPSDRGQARRATVDPDPPQRPAGLVRSPVGDPGQGLGAAQNGGQLMAATTTTAWVIDRGQYVPHRDENVAILVRAPLTECLDGRDERGYGCGHGRPPRRSSWTSSTHNDPGTSRARPACTPTRRVRPGATPSLRL